MVKNRYTVLGLLPEDIEIPPEVPIEPEARAFLAERDSLETIGCMRSLFGGTITEPLPRTPRFLRRRFFQLPIKELECQMTFFNGELVFTRSPNDEQ